MKGLSIFQIKKYALLIVCFGLTVGVTAQLAIINDEDGFTNVRQVPNSKAEVIYKLHSNQLFGYYDDDYISDKNWVLIYILKNKFSMQCGQSYLIGYIHKSRIKPLETIKTYNEARIAYTFKPFSKENKIIELGQYGYIKINGRGYWGDDGIASVETERLKMTILSL